MGAEKERDEIEITPEMINAGARYLETLCDVSENYAATIVPDLLSVVFAECESFRLVRSQRV